MNQLRIAVIQKSVPLHKDEGEAQIRRMVAEICREPVDMIGLPEDCVTDYEDIRNGYDAMAFLSSVAKEYGVYLFGATAVIADKKQYNRGFLFDRNGVLIDHHDKYAVTPPEAEQGVVAGNTLGVFDTEFGKLAILVCFDAFNRYAAWSFDALRKADAEIILVPSYSLGGISGFSRKDIDSWVLSLRVLARWFGVYIAGPGTIGKNATPYLSFGHAIIVSPNGGVIAEGSSDKEEILRAVLDPGAIEESRSKMWPPFEPPLLQINKK